ncbi:hypothetical protein Pth03_24440 [Planotetraspora thailandica]|uniref:Uncharacterized protein n=1 Tax=Planotetraspora thailandica TaxID=487172 RepID=A0A8J3V0M9_9ACTN|nr:hypothetical protein [Planotetraspora thailandica]GII54055.1 hypothetical protein Pth03_24440 [Planotetraspora thailandica]
MAGFKEAVGRSLTWAAKNVDGAIALVLAVVVGVLGVLPDPVIDDDTKRQLISSTTLVILALVATALLRDRVRQEPVETAINAASGVLAQLPERLRRLDELESLVGDTKRALEDMSVVRILGSQQEITQAHADARRGALRWSFKGGTGTYMRAVTLPECVAAARREKRHLTIRVEIIDPSDEEVCESYAHYRRSLSDRPDGTGELWTTERVRKESFATVLAAFWYRQRFGLLDIGVGLSSTMTTFRWDLSSHMVIMTVEDPNRAMAALSGTFYYESCDTELRTSFEQARKVPVDRYKAVPLSEEPTVEEVRRFFDRIDLPLPKSYTDREVVEITRKALRAKDPYA